MHSRSILAAVVAIGLSALPVVVQARCLPRTVGTTEEDAAAELSSQALDWSHYKTIYLATITGLSYPDPDAPPMLSGPNHSHQVTLVADKVLKGALAPEFTRTTLSVTVVCGIWSDLARGEVGDQFVIYAGPDGPTDRSGGVARDRIRDRDTLAAMLN